MSSLTSLTLIAAGFVLVTASVIALARSSTARWEQTRRAARAPRRRDDVPSPPAPGLAGLPRRIARRVVAAARGARSAVTPLERVAGHLVRVPEQLVSRLRSVPRSVGGFRSSRPWSRLGRGRSSEPGPRDRPGQDDATDRAEPVVLKRFRSARSLRPRDAGPLRRALLRRTPSLPRRRRRGLRYDRTDS